MADRDGEAKGRPFRRHVRVEVRLNVDFVFEGDETEEIFRAYTKNISLGGLCIQAFDRTEEISRRIRGDHARMTVSLSLPGDAVSLDLSARTAWIDARLGWVVSPSRRESPLLMGVNFIDLADADVETISTFIADAIVSNRESIVEVEKRIISEISGEPD